jgi:hypothetical protein
MRSVSFQRRVSLPPQLSYLSLSPMVPKSKLLYDWQSVSQSVSMSWYRAPLWDLRPDVTSCRNVAVWNLRSCVYWAPSLTRGRVCLLPVTVSSNCPSSSFEVRLLYDSRSVSQSVSQSVCLGIEHPSGLATRYYFLSECCCLKFAVLFLWAPSPTRGRVCNLQYNHWMVRVAQNP